MSTELANPVLNVDKCSVLLLDIAGTTTSNVFLKESLFSYVDKQVETFLKEKWDDEAVKEAVKSLKDDTLDQEAAVALVKELTEKNSDNKGLKTLQGLIYKKGYESGELKADVFPDVPATLESWSKSRKVAIYSTGSTESQKLLFSHTTEGDLSGHIAQYFDQNVGPKTESGSYEKISKELDVKAQDIVFVTDSVEEAKAAKTAGLIASLIVREGNKALPEEVSKEFPVVSSLKDVALEKSVKRKNEEDVPSKDDRPTKVAKTENGTNGSNCEEGKPDDVPKEQAVVNETMEVDASVEKPDTVAEKPQESTPNTAEIQKSEEKPTETKTEVTEAKIAPSKNEETEEKGEKDDSKEATSKDVSVVEEEKMDTTTCDKVESKESVDEANKEPTETKPSTQETDVATEKSNTANEDSKNDAEPKKLDEETKEPEKEENEKKETEAKTDQEETQVDGEPTKKAENGEENEESKTEEKVEIFEKENNSVLANGGEGDVANGDKQTEEKQNGESSEATESTVDEIKAKKIDEAPSTESAPSVSVEV
ncbi:unnamed protein product [Phyllotreta striolata]|uniref:Enolase-phosphatase E1 n=1 Tax=Phyllotreta striolata TaxID=444603 RepID=A0A9N9XQS8_PHYSR|nr:unnamed protein product [Phyllotreta striolata]